MQVRDFTMDNGATVSDWLGTAATAAKVAGMYLEDVRNCVAGLDKLLEARAQAVQAVEEIDAILVRLGSDPNA